MSFILMIRRRIRSLKHRLESVLVAVLLFVSGCFEKPTPKPTPASQLTYFDPDAGRVDSDHESDTVQQKDWFIDVTATTGIDAQFHSGRGADRFTILETVGGGICLFDLDLDGDLDVFCAGGGTFEESTGRAIGVPGRLFRNNQHFQFADITAESGLELPSNYSHGAIAGDYDLDGDPDLFLYCFGQSHLYRNDNGHFSDVTAAAGLLFSSWDTSAVMADFNGDGWPDLFVVTYVEFDPTTAKTCQVGDRKDVCPPQNYSPLPDRLYVNQGDGTFKHSSVEAGLSEPRRGLGVLASDFNRDGRIDLYVANDGEPNDLYMGTDEFPWSESALPAGVAVNEKGAAEGSMGIDAQDIDGDGLPELVVTNFELEDNALYKNLGAGIFEHATAKFGLAGASRAYVGFGTGLCDLDGDNWPDWYVVNGHVLYETGQSPYLQPSFLFRNNEGRRLQDHSKQAGTFFRQRHAARGSVAADLNNDGGPDIVISRLEKPVIVLKNQHPPTGWISIQLRPRGGDLCGLGSEVSIEAFGRTFVQVLRSAGSFASFIEPHAHFSVEASRTEVEVRVRWASGRSELFESLKPNRTHRFHEGTGRVPR